MTKKKKASVPARFLKHRTVKMTHENDFEVQACVDDKTLKPLVKTYDSSIKLVMTPNNARQYAYALLNRAALAEELSGWEREQGTKPRRKP